MVVCRQPAVKKVPASASISPKVSLRLMGENSALSDLQRKTRALRFRLIYLLHLDSLVRENYALDVTRVDTYNSIKCHLYRPRLWQAKTGLSIRLFHKQVANSTEQAEERMVLCASLIA